MTEPEEPPPPPPPPKSFSTRAMTESAKVLRPFLPRRFEEASDREVCAAAALGVGGLLAGVAMIIVGIRLSRLASKALARQAERMAQKRAARRLKQVNALLERLEAQSKAVPSLHESAVALGMGAPLLQCLDKAGDVERALHGKSASWMELLSDDEEGLLRKQALIERWSFEVLKLVVHAACKASPALGGELRVELVESGPPYSLDVSFVRPDGLGATLSSEQQGAHEALMVTIQRSLGELNQPYLLASRFLRDLGITIGTAETIEEERFANIFSVGLLLFGGSAVDHAGPALGQQIYTGELRQAFERHLQVVGTPIEAEGVATWLAQRAEAGAMPGMGGVLAATGGAAIKPQAASLRLRQFLTPLLNDTQFATAAGFLGRSLSEALAVPELPPGMEAALGNLCGVGTTSKAHERATALQEKWGKPPIEELGLRRFKLPSLSQAVLEAHVRSTLQAHQGATRTTTRILALLRALSAPEFSQPLRGQGLLGAVVASLDCDEVLAPIGLDLLKVRRQVRQALARNGVQFTSQLES